MLMTPLEFTERCVMIAEKVRREAENPAARHAAEQRELQKRRTQLMEQKLAEHNELQKRRAHLMEGGTVQCTPGVVMADLLKMKPGSWYFLAVTDGQRREEMVVVRKADLQEGKLLGIPAQPISTALAHELLAMPSGPGRSLTINGRQFRILNECDCKPGAPAAVQPAAAPPVVNVTVNVPKLKRSIKTPERDPRTNEIREVTEEYEYDRDQADQAS